MKYLLLFLIPLNAFAVSNRPIHFGSTFVVKCGFYRGCTGYIVTPSSEGSYWVNLECKISKRTTRYLEETRLLTSEFTLDK